MKKISAIYCFENIINGHKYIGQSMDLEYRTKRHFRDLRNGVDDVCVLQNAWNKYGENNFKWYIVEECSVEELDNKEIFYIKEWHTHVDEGGYNISLGGDVPMRGRKHTEETKKKISEKNTGLLVGELNPFYGKKHTEEELQKMSENHKDMNGENNGMYGKNHTEETRKKMSENYNRENRKLRGTPSTETKEKMRISKIGQKHSEETKEKMSKNRSNKKHRNSSSQYIGVCFSPASGSLWLAYIRYKRKTIRLGSFENEIDAAIAYNQRAIELFGDQARLNIIE